jgi:hypothetical protein
MDAREGIPAVEAADGGEESAAGGEDDGCHLTRAPVRRRGVVGDIIGTGRDIIGTAMAGNVHTYLIHMMIVEQNKCTPPARTTLLCTPTKNKDEYEWRPCPGYGLCFDGPIHPAICGLYVLDRVLHSAHHNAFYSSNFRRTPQLPALPTQ